MHPGEAPGLGVDVDEELAARYPKLLQQVEINLAQPEDVKAWLGKDMLKFLEEDDALNKSLMEEAGFVAK